MAEDMALFDYDSERIEKADMETRVAIIGIIVEAESSVESLNQILHEYGFPTRRKTLILSVLLWMLRRM